MVRRRSREIGEQTLEIRALEFTGLYASGGQIFQLSVVGLKKPLDTIIGLREFRADALLSLRAQAVHVSRTKPRLAIPSETERATEECRLMLSMIGAWASNVTSIPSRA